MPAAGGDWEFCFEFTKPGDSERTRSFEVALLAAADRLYRLVTTSLDRRGESIVCLIGRVEDLPAGAMIEAVEVAAPRPVRLRRLGGGNRDQE